MLLIVGTEGHLGKKVIQHVLQYQYSHHFCLLTTQREQHQIWQQQGLQSHCISVNEYEKLYTLMSRCDSMCFLSKCSHPSSIEYEKNLIDLAAQANVKQIFYTGLAAKNIQSAENGSLIKAQYDVQKYLERSELNCSFIHRSMCIEAIPSFIGQQVLEQGVMVAAGNGRVPYVSCEDIAKAIAKIISQPSGNQRHYHLTGRHAYSFGDIAKILSQLAQKTVHYIDADRAVYRQKLLDLQVSSPVVKQRLAMLSDIKAHRYEVESDDLNQLIGKRQMMLSDYLQRCYAL